MCLRIYERMAGAAAWTELEEEDVTKRIDELDAISGDVADADLLFIEDVSDTTSTESTKRVQVSVLLASLGVSDPLAFEEVSYSDDTELIASDMGKGLLVTFTATSKTLTLPALTDGHTIFIRNAGSNAFTLAGNGSETIDGNATLTISATDYVYLIAVSSSGSSNGWTVVNSQIT